MKNKLVLLVAVAAMAFVWLRWSAGKAPLADGAFLLYRQGETTVRLTFHHVTGDDYRTVVEVADGGGPPEIAPYMTGHSERVDGGMRTASGAVYELGPFGPLWVPPAQLEEGGNAHGTRIQELRSFNGREVAVVAASVGMGAALRGEWYYDVATGFLVGGLKATAVSDSGMRFELVDSNVAGLDGR